MKVKIVMLIILGFMLMCSAANAAVLDNTKHVAVYLDNSSEMAHDNFFTAMFYEYNLTYLFNNTLSADNLTNIDLLLISGNRVSNESAVTINNFMSNGGHVWFFGDPRFNSSGSLMDTRFEMFTTASNSAYEITKNSTLTFVSDSITAGLPASYKKDGAIGRSTYARKHASDTNTVGNYTYKALCYMYWDCRLMVKYENTTTGSKVLYSNPDCFISGGSTNYFNRSVSTQLFNQAKTWILDLEKNNYNVQITYPKGDKVYTTTLDDMFLSDSEILSTSDYINMKNALPYKVPDTVFVCWNSSYTTKNSIDYFNGLGFDTHAVHPHENNGSGLGWGVSATPVDTFASVLQTYHISTMNEKAQETDYGAHVYRFPGTTGSTNASIAMANAGMWVSANRGPNTNLGAIGDTLYNNIFFPKQKIFNSGESCTVEIETPTKYDIDETNGTTLYASQLWSFNYFSGVNFPSNYVMGAHKQGIMQNAYLRDNASLWLNYLCNNSSYTVFDTLSNIAAYNNAIDKANITVSNITNGVQVDIIAVDPITNFTVKMNNISNGLQIQYDGTDIGIDNVVYEDNLYYIFHDVESGSHTITIEDVVISDDYSIYNGKNNAQSKPIKNNIYKCVNNAANETTFTMTTNNIFTGNNSVSTSSNSVAVDGRSSASPLNMFVTPSTGIINVSVSVLESTNVIWTESSDSESVVTHVIGGFPANTDIDIYRDGVDYDTVKSNSTGYITWVYDGGFSEHTFEAIPHATAGMRDSFVDSWGNTVSMIGAIIVIALAGSAIAVFRGKRDISDLVNDLPGIVLIVVMLVVGAIIFGQF